MNIDRKRIKILVQILVLDNKKFKSLRIIKLIDLTLKKLKIKIKGLREYNLIKEN
jgi:hypothetical protein